MKTLFTSTALALVLAGGAMAANHVSETTFVLSDGSPAATPMANETPFTVDRNYTVDGYEAYTDPLTIADVEEAPLYSTVTGEEIGEVEDTVSENDVLAYLVLDVGGFLGIGEKTVSVQPSEVMAMRNPGLGDTRIYINATKEQLEALPDYNSQAAAAMESAVGTLEGNVATGEGTVVPAEAVTDERIVEDTQGAALTEQPVVDDTETMMADTDAVVVTDADPVTPMTETTPGDETAVVVGATDTMATDTMATDRTFMNRRDERVSEPMFGDTAFTNDPNYAVDGYERYDGTYDQMLTEGDVEEAPLYSAVTGDEIGEVEDALEENGVLAALVLDIGGFLGMGEHTITVAPDQVMYMRDPGVLSNVRVYINATEEQLKEYPSYNADLQGLE